MKDKPSNHPDVLKGIHDAFHHEPPAPRPTPQRPGFLGEIDRAMARGKEKIAASRARDQRYRDYVDARNKKS